MIYAKQIITASGVSLYTPLVSIIRVTKGLVYKVEFHFPLGSAGLMGVSVWDGGYQVWPSSVGECFTGDQIVISFDDIYVKENPPFEFQICTWNLDDTYDHLINIRIGMVSKEIYQARYLPHLAYKEFVSMIATFLQQQEAERQLQAEEILVKPFTWVPEQAVVEGAE